jgi:hypothetical protein
MKKRVLSFTLILTIALTFVPLGTQTALAETGHGSNGKFFAPINPPMQGSIPISNRAELEAIRNNLSGNFHLTADIDLSGAEWIPIGNASNPFRGVFDGQGFVIQNMKITNYHQHVGLFGNINGPRVSAGAQMNEIKNVGVENALISITVPGGVSWFEEYRYWSHCW